MIKTLTTLLVTVLTAVACQSAGNTSARADIIIASDLPTSAFDSALPFEHAIDFAIRSRSTIEGYSVAYWPLDNSLGAQQSQLRGRGNVRRMIADPSVLGMVGPFSSFVGRIEIPEANRAHLAMISMTTTSSCLTLAIRVCQPTAAELRPTGTNNFFRLPAPDPAQGKAMAAYAATSPTVDAIANPDPAVKDLVNAYLKAYPAASTADLFPNVTAYTFAAFDCARILIDAIGRAIKANGGKLPNRMQVVTAVAQTKD